LTAGKGFAVFTVDTRDLVFDGGTRSFTLNVSETGCLPRRVTVTLNVATTCEGVPGAAVFKVVERDGNDVEYLERVGGNFEGLVEAFTWVENNAEANTEYTIRVEKDETNLPHLIVGLNAVKNATLRLKGTKEGPWTLSATDSYAPVVGGQSSFISRESTDSFIQIGGVPSSGFIGAYPKRTFILGSNITIRSGALPLGWEQTYVNVFHVYANATLVLEPGSAITDHNTSRPVIAVNTSNGPNTNNDPTLDGKLRIEGGSITGCTLSIDSSLIFISGNPDFRSSDSFYLAPGNVLTLEGNSDNNLGIHSPANTFDLTRYLASGLSLPPLPTP
jgi:hypothetical protein